MKPDVNEEDVQKKYLELQLLGKRIQAGQQQLEALDEQLQALARTIRELESFKELRQGSEMLSSIAEGLFVKSSLQDNNELIVNVGSGVAVVKPVDKAQHMIRGRMEAGQRHRAALIEELERMMLEAQEFQKELGSMLE